MKIRVHVILDELDRQIVEVVRSIPGVEIVQWDYSFDTAYQWTANNREERIDIFLASEYAQVSNTDERGRQIPRDKALLKRVRDLYLMRPYVKFLLLCDPDRKAPGNREFLSNLVSIGIYDFRTEDTLTEEMIEQFIKEPKRDISYVAEFLPGGFESIQKHTSHDVKQFEFENEEEEEEEELLPLIKKRLIDFLKKPKEPKKSRLTIKKDNDKESKIKNIIKKKEGSEEVSVLRKETPVDIPQDVPTQNLKPVAPAGTIYSLGLDSVKGTVNFNTWEQLLKASDMIHPSAILLANDVSALIEKIRYLKDNYKAQVIIIGDVEGNEVLYAGADFYFKEWDDIAYSRLMEDIESTNSYPNIYSREYFKGILDKQIDRSLIRKRIFSILIISIDGCQVKNKILNRFTSFLSANIQSSNPIIKYGDNEFIVVLPETDKEKAKKIANQLRHDWIDSGIPGITFSGGIAEFGLDSKKASELISNANAALYKAKESGGDNICVFGERIKSKSIIMTRPGKMRTQVFVIAGAAPRVGATSFCIALAGYLSEKYPIEIIDAGGGAINWIRDGSIRVRRPEPISVTPGVITLIDAGTDISEEVQPFANMVFLVTDLSRSAIQFKSFIEKSNNICLIGNRGASLKGLHELGELWGIDVIGTLSEEAAVKEAEINGKVVIPRKWRKELQEVRRLLR